MFAIHASRAWRVASGSRQLILCLVRPVRFLLLSTVVLAAASCATTPVHDGRYLSQLSAEDLQQITVLVEQRRDIPKPILRIWAARPDSVVVETRQNFANDLRVQAVLHKRRGRWIIDERSIEWERLVTLH